MRLEQFNNLPSIIRGVVIKKAEENERELESYLSDLDTNFTILTNNPLNPFPMWSGDAFNYVVYADKETAEAEMLEGCDLCVVTEEQAVIYLAGLAKLVGY